MTNTIFETRNRKLEQFLFLHGIPHISFRKDADGMTVWKYENTSEAQRVVEEFREIQARRQVRRAS